MIVTKCWGIATTDYYRIAGYYLACRTKKHNINGHISISMGIIVSTFIKLST